MARARRAWAQRERGEHSVVRMRKGWAMRMRPALPCRRDEGTYGSSGFSCYAGRLPCSSLHLDFDGDGKPAPHAKGLGRDFEYRSGLLALVFGTLDQTHHLFDEIEGESVFFC